MRMIIVYICGTCMWYYIMYVYIILYIYIYITTLYPQCIRHVQSSAYISGPTMRENTRATDVWNKKYIFTFGGNIYLSL